MVKDLWKVVHVLEVMQQAGHLRMLNVCRLQSTKIGDPSDSTPYTTNLAPCNFWLFPKLKSHLKEKRFQTIGEIQDNTMGQLMEIPTNDFAECFEQWKRCWENHVKFQGAYFEED